MLNGDIDLLPDSNQTLEGIKKYSSAFNSVIKEMERTLTEDKELNQYITKILQGYEEVKKLKKEKIDKVDEAAMIESEQLEYDQHFESLVDLIIKVSPMYYREKCIEDKNKTEPMQINTQKSSQIPDIQFTPNKGGNVPIKEEMKRSYGSSVNINIQKPNNSPILVQKPNSAPLKLVQKPKSQAQKKLNIQFANNHNPNDKKE